jgi:5-methylcytosine-specific restriction endonuclease McrA
MEFPVKQDSRLTGPELLDFVENQMNMTGYYQPVIIAALVKAGGHLSRQKLAKEILLADEDSVDRAQRTLMRWPKATLTKHGILEYDRYTQTFTLCVRSLNNAEQATVLAACAQRLAEWNRQEAPTIASARFAAIESAGGRCQACGVLGSVRPLDVDHIRPRNRARKGKVQDSTGRWIPVDASENLQVLCSKCNRGKRDVGNFDFRPREERLVETIRLTLELADSLGLSAAEIAEQALSEFRSE